MKHILQIFLLVFLSIVSCNQRQETSIKEIEVSYKMADGKIDDLIEKFEIITLDTCIEAHFNYANKIVLSDSLYFIKSENKVLVFGNKGDYLFDIDRTGRGPDEYVYLNDFFYDETAEEIVLAAQDNLYVFDINGDLKRTEKMEFGFHTVHKTLDGKYVFGKIFPEGDGCDYNLILTDENFNLLNTMISLPIKDEKGGLHLGQSGRAKSNFGRDYYFSLFCDTVYRIVDGRVIPEAAFNYDKEVFSVTGKGRSLDRETNYIYFNYSETVNHRLLRFNLNRNDYMAIINRESDEVRVVDGYIDISNSDGDAFILWVNPQYLKRLEEPYKPDKCVNRELYDEIMNNPENYDNLLIRIYLDL